MSQRNHDAVLNPHTLRLDRNILAQQESDALVLAYKTFVRPILEDEGRDGLVYAEVLMK